MVAKVVGGYAYIDFLQIMVYNKKIMSHSNTESFYVTSSQLPIDMETESHPSGLVIFSRELTHGDGVTGHIIVSPKNHHTDIYSDYLGHNPQLVDERIRWGGGSIRPLAKTLSL